MSYSNVYFDKRTNKIHCWEFINGEKVYNVDDAPLYFYIKDNNGNFKTIYGDNARKISFSTYKEFQEKCESFKDAKIEVFESDVAIETKYIVEKYAKQELTIPKNLDIHLIDIEVHSNEGFPKPDNANGKITIITSYSTLFKKYYIFTCQDFNTQFLDSLNEEYEKFLCYDEKDLIRKFMRWIRLIHPDIISGWNINGYDIPYIVNRAEKLLGNTPELYEEKSNLLQELDKCSDSKKEEINKRLNEIKKLTSSKYAKNMSPLKKIKEVEIFDKKTNKKITKFLFPGINVIDLLEVYRTYTPSGKESYSLDFISSLEIDETKNKYEGSLADLYNNNWQQYVEYNIQDVRLLNKLNNKLGYMELLITFCYGCRVPFEQYQKTTKVLDGAFVSKLYEEHIVLPDVNRDNIKETFPGGFVMSPETGLHEWVMSFDATSLYPSIMIGWNISPETKKANVVIPHDPNDSVEEVTKKIREHIDPILSYMENEDEIIGNKIIDIKIKKEIKKTNIKKLCQIIKENKLCISTNGVLYSTKQMGVVPRFVNEWFNKRKEYKKKMLDAKANGDKEKEKYYNLLQLNFKILINSVYGFVGTVFSRLYDLDNAAAVTSTGQTITQKTVNCLNNYFNNCWQNSELGIKYNATNFNDFVIYSDTDSVYVSGDKILKSISFEEKNISPTDIEVMCKQYSKYDLQVVEKDNDVLFISNKDGKIKQISHDKKDANTVFFIKTNLETFIQNIIDHDMNKLSIDICNCPENKIFFKRESIARRVIFTEKKKYCMWVLNDEGDIPINKMKVTGLDIVRSSTPSLIRKEMNDLVFDILKHVDYDKTITKIKKIRNTFMECDPIQIGFTKPCNNLKKYLNSYNNSLKSKKLSNGKHHNYVSLLEDDEGQKNFERTPIHVRGSILFNELVKDDNKLKKNYDLIYDGDKIKFVYMKVNNEWTHDVISFKDKLPYSEKLTPMIDRERQFNISLIKPISRFFDLLNWKIPEFNQTNLMSLFMD